jgi:hypothetical protein
MNLRAAVARSRPTSPKVQLTADGKERTMKNATLVAGLLVFMVQFTIAQNQPFVGNWTVDLAKSRYESEPGPKSEILRFEPVADRFKVSLDGVNEQGPYHSEATGKFDGVDVPVLATPARPARFTYAFSRIDDHTWDIVIKVNGDRRILVHNVVSDDGKTMRSVSTATTNQGQIVTQDVIYRKQ